MTTTKRPPLTKKQQEILAYYRRNTRAAGPTCREVQSHFGFRSPNAVTTHIVALLKKGFLRRNGSGPRNIEVIA